MNIYKDISELEIKLKNVEVYSLSNQIKQILEAGSTVTEILMELRWRFKKALTQNELPPVIKSDIEIMIKKLDELLK